MGCTSKLHIYEVNNTIQHKFNLDTPMTQWHWTTQATGQPNMTFVHLVTAGYLVPTPETNIAPENQWLFALCGWMLCAVLRGLPLRKHFLLEWPIYVLFDGEVYPFGGSNNSKQSVTCIDKINCPQRINKTWAVPTTNIQASITRLTQITYIGIGLYNVKHLTFNKYAMEHHDTTYPLLVASSNLKY